MKYFYCQSYQAFNLALSIDIQEDIIVITASKNIIKACKYLKVKYVVHEPFSLKDFGYKYNAINTEIKKLITVIGEDELHFSHTQFAVFCFLLVTRLNEANRKTCFHNFELVYDRPKYVDYFKRKYLKAKLYHAAIKYLYKLPVVIRKSSKNSFILSFNLSYLKQDCFRYIDDKNTYYDLTLNMFKSYSFDYPEIDHLFVAQTFSNEDLYIKDKIRELLPIINSEMISVKNHPKFGSIEGLERCATIPEFLPVELFFQKVKKSIISIHSATLITASKFHGIDAISLIDIVRTDDNFMEKMKADIIRKSNDKVLFPLTISQFRKQLAN